MMNCDCEKPCNKGIRYPIATPLPTHLQAQLVEVLSKPHLEISDLNAGSHAMARWKCAEPNHPTWDTTVKSRSAGNNCPYCSGLYPIPGETDLATTHPELIEEWDHPKNAQLGITPEKISIGSSKKLHWKCSKGHEWKASPVLRSRSNCPLCSGRIAIPGETDFSTTHPHLLEEWDYEKNLKEYNLTPQQVKAGSSNVKHHWKCAEGHQWASAIAWRVQDNLGCPLCSGRIAIPGETDFSTTHPHLLEEWDYEKNLKEYNLTPPQVKASSSSKQHYWLCKQHEHSFKTAIANRTSKAGAGCPYCSNKRVLAGFNDLATTDPLLLKEWDYKKNNKLGVFPDKLTRGAETFVWWKCENGHSWKSLAYARTGKQAKGCPKCAITGVSKSKTKLLDFIKANLPVGEVILDNDRTFLGGKLELDIYLPNKNLAIEFNGLYWHTEARGKDKKYHHNKYLLCKNKGVQLIQIWEDDWLYREELVKRVLLHKLGVSKEPKINARELTVIHTIYPVAKDFMEANHIQGTAIGTHYLALQDKNQEIKALLTLLRTKTGYQISRYCSAGIVRGGFGKLLAYAEKNYMSPGEVLTTFSDNCISDGGLYLATGFKQTAEIKPDYSYVMGLKRSHKFNYRLKRFKTDSTLLYEEGLTEPELARLNGLERIWDAGKIKWEKQF